MKFADVLATYRKARRKMPLVKVTRDPGMAMWMSEQSGLRKLPLSERAGIINVPRGDKGPLSAFFHEAGHVVHGHGGVVSRLPDFRKMLNHERAANRAARNLAGKAGDAVAKTNRPFFNDYRKHFIKILNGGNASTLGQTKEILRQNPYLRGYGFSAKLRVREFARGDFAIPVVEAILGRKLGSGVKDALRNRGQRIHTPPPEFVGKKLKSEAEAQLKGKGLAGERQVQYTDVVPTLVLPDRFRPGEATPQWYTPRYGIHNSQVTPSKLRSILKDGLKAKPAPGGQPPLLFMHPSGESAGVVGKFPRIRSGRDQGTLSFLTENPGDFSYSRGGAPGSITSKVSNKRSWIVDPDFYGGKPLSGKIKQVLDETGTKPIIPETIQGDGVTLLYPKEYFGDYNRNYWAKKIKENRSKNLSAKLRLRELARGDYAIPALGKMLKDRSFLEEFMTGKRGPKLGDLASTHYGVGRIMNKNKYLPSSPLEKITNIIRGKPKPVAVPNVEEYALMRARNDRNARNTVAKIIKGRAGGDVYEELNLSAKLRLREFARGDFAKVAWDKIGVKVPSEGVPGAFVSGVGKHRIGTAGFMENKLKGNPRLASKMAIRMGVSPSALTAENSMKRKWIASALRNARNAKELSAKLRLREFSALRKRIRVNWHPDGSARMTIRDQHGGSNEIGRIETTDSSIVDWQKQKLATRGQIKHTWIDPKFRGMGLATKMYGEAMKQAPRGRLVSDNAQFDGGYAIWNRLQRNKGYKIRENPKADGAEDGFVSRDKRPLFIGRINPAARKQNDLSAKLRLRELARGDYAIPALGKMLKDRSFLEEFLTGKRGPKLGDLSVGKIYPGGKISALRPPKKSDFHISGWTKGQMLGTEPVGPQNARWRDALIEERIRGRKENFKKNRDSLSDVARNVPLGNFPPGLTAEEAAWAQSARTAARNNAAKMLRKGRAGGDVYEDIDRKFFCRAGGDVYEEIVRP